MRCDSGCPGRGQGLEENENRERKIEPDRMAAMLSRLGKRGYSVQEESPAYRIDFDSDPDFDPEETISQQADAGRGEGNMKRHE